MHGQRRRHRGEERRGGQRLGGGRQLRSPRPRLGRSWGRGTRPQLVSPAAVVAAAPLEGAQAGEPGRRCTTGGRTGSAGGGPVEDATVSAHAGSEKPDGVRRMGCCAEIAVVACVEVRPSQVGRLGREVAGAAPRTGEGGIGLVPTPARWRGRKPAERPGREPARATPVICVATAAACGPGRELALTPARGGDGRAACFRVGGRARACGGGGRKGRTHAGDGDEQGRHAGACADGGGGCGPCRGRERLHGGEGGEGRLGRQGGRTGVRRWPAAGRGRGAHVGHHSLGRISPCPPLFGRPGLCAAGGGWEAAPGREGGASRGQRRRRRLLWERAVGGCSGKRGKKP
jgi:hypothetical protein